MRYIMAGLLLCAACSGGGDKSGTTTGPAVVASVQLNAAVTTIAVGGTTTITAIALDASGNSVTGQSVVWQSANAGVATVAAGLVTGVSPGTVTITATIGTKAAQRIITVTAPANTACTGITPITLGVGLPHVLTASERTTLCVAGGAAGSEYVLIPFKADTIGSPVSVAITALGTNLTVGPPTAASASVAASAALIPANANTRLLSSAVHGEFGAAFEHRLRVREREQLTPIVHAAQRGVLKASMQRSAIQNLATAPALGTYFKLNANANDACTNRQDHTARIAAISNSAIIAVDSLAPANGFTDAEYANFAATFDTLIFALDTSAYGAPADLDGNKKVLIFFTQAVNALTAKGSGGYIGGFFYARDLFPTTNVNALLQACPASNVGEMFYVPVLDPTQIYNEFFVDKAALQIELIGTLAHEFQHLINASRRLYVTQTQNWDEDVWLNEGMSHLAEELLYFRVSGFGPKQALALATVAGNQAALNAINNYEVQNLARLEDYLLAPGLNSPYAQNDSLPTRGATYQLLRYALDQSPGTNSSYLHALINTQQTGVANFNNVFGATFGNSIFTAVQQQVIANYFSGSTIPIAAQYTFPSWNYRDVIGNGLNKKVNPLAQKALVGAGPVTFNLTNGGAGYGRFGITANGTATITALSGAGAVPASIVMILIRTQ